MASTLSVSKIQGLSSAASPTTVEIASGHKITGAAGSVIIPGQVIQSKSFLYDTEHLTTSTSYVASDVTLSITPTSASNKILAFFSVPLYGSGAGVATCTLYRNSTDLAVNTSNNNYGFGYVNNNIPGNISGHILDSPNTTSSTTYTIYHKRSSASNSYVCINACTASLTLLEIAQ